MDPSNFTTNTGVSYYPTDMDVLSATTDMGVPNRTTNMDAPNPATNTGVPNRTTNIDVPNPTTNGDAPNPYLVYAYALMMYPEKTEQINERFLQERTQAVLSQAAATTHSNPFDEVRSQVESGHAAWRAKWNARFQKPANT